MNLNKLLGKNGVVAVSFDNSDRLYHYFLPNYIHLEDIKINDRVIVDSPFTGLTTVTVEEKSYDYSLINSKSKPIVALVDTSSYNKWVEDKIAINRRLMELEYLEMKKKLLGELAEDTEINKLLGD